MKRRIIHSKRYKDVPRVDGSQIVAENGYDVHSVAKWLEGYYLSKTNGE